MEYDIENGRSKYAKMFIEGETVWVQEKLHGSNCSVTFTDGQIQVHSRTQWQERDENNLFWKAILAQPKLLEYCEQNPNTLVYGEIYGFNPGFKYDCKDGEVKFKCFDIKRPDGMWHNPQSLVNICTQYEIPMAPIHGFMEYNFTVLSGLAESDSLLGNKIKEGIVFRPKEERYDMKCGRVICKLVSSKYLEKS